MIRVGPIKQLIFNDKSVDEVFYDENKTAGEFCHLSVDDRI